MQRQAPSTAGCYEPNGDAAMEIDREDSPETVVGDVSARLTPANPQGNIEIIDLEAIGGQQTFDANDYMTDQEFKSAFGNAASSRTSDDSHMNNIKVTNLSSVSNKTYKKGETVELHNGDFLRIVDVLEDSYTQEKTLQGFRLRRLSKCRPLFDQHLNELTIVMEETDVDIQTNGGGSMETASLSEVLRIRAVVMTNAPYPSYACKEDVTNSGRPRDFLREQCRLVCRWKMTTSYRPHVSGRKRIETSIVRLRAHQADTDFRLQDERLRRRWRGFTTKGGSCAAWLPGEKAFDANERRGKEGIDNFNFNPGLDQSRESAMRSSKGHRYTFGDAYCGAGGASRAAKGAGCRIEWGFDCDVAAIHAYRENFFAARCEGVPADVFINILDEDFLVDILHISPPCGVWSPMHTRQGKDDETNQATFFAVGEIIKKAKPRVVTLENTFGLVERWPAYLDALIHFFTALNFSVRWRVFNLAHYGLPQARRRLIIFASCPGEPLPEYPRPTHGPGLIPFSTVNEAINKIPRGFPNHNPEGVPKRNQPPYDGNSPLKNCVTTAGSLDCHPNGQRIFTDRETICLQTFPLQHRFGKVGVKKQAGNAVPPLPFKVFITKICKSLEESDR
ncbi:MAG: hypothetical protein Q9166_000801 [cf. Caloplaca sp. 2 TL-2023]